MPSKTTLKRAQQDAREGKRPTTQAGEFVREEIEHIREGKHGARSTKQAIAIGLSKARRRPPAASGWSSIRENQAEREKRLPRRSNQAASKTLGTPITHSLKRAETRRPFRSNTDSACASGADYGSPTHQRNAPTGEKHVIAA